MSTPRRCFLPAALLLAFAAHAQPAAEAEGQRALRAAEDELREALRRVDEGSLRGSLGVSRLRQALNEVERAMLRLPAGRRDGQPWQAAVREVSGALATLRESSGDLGAARAAAGNALATLPALRGEETGG